MIYILAEHQAVAQEYLDKFMIDADSAFIVTCPEDVPERPYDPAHDALIALPGTPDILLFELTVR